MKPEGLIPEEWVVSYAAGSLNEAHALVVASHIDYHPELQTTLREAEDIGGALLENNNPIEMSEDAFDQLLDKLDALPELVEPSKTELNSDLPAPLADYLKGDLENQNWKWMGPGMKQAQLWKGPNGEKLWLLKAKGGTEMPKHDHRGLEMTLVLKGSYHVGESHFTPGLIELADQDLTNHEPKIDEGEDCICLVVTEAPIIIHNIIGKIVQPFIGL